MQETDRGPISLRVGHRQSLVLNQSINQSSINQSINQSYGVYVHATCSERTCSYSCARQLPSELCTSAAWYFDVVKCSSCWPVSRTRYFTLELHHMPLSHTHMCSLHSADLRAILLHSPLCLVCCAERRRVKRPCASALQAVRKRSSMQCRLRAFAREQAVGTWIARTPSERSSLMTCC